MKRLDYWRAQLKLVKAEHRQRSKEYNQAERALTRAYNRLTTLEAKIERATTKLARA